MWGIESRKGRDARNLGAARTESSNWGKLQAEIPGVSSWAIQNPNEQYYGMGGHQNKRRFEEYGDTNYTYNPYRDYSHGWIQINMRQIRKLKSETHPPSKNQPPRKPPGIAKENENAEEKPTIILD